MVSNALNIGKSIFGFIKKQGLNLRGPLKHFSPKPITDIKLDKSLYEDIVVLSTKSNTSTPVIEAKSLVGQSIQPAISNVKNIFKGKYRNFDNKTLDISEYFDNQNVLRLKIIKNGKEIPVQQQWFYTESDDTLKIIDIAQNKVLMETDEAYNYLDELINLQENVKSGLISKDHFAFYLAEAMPLNKLEIINHSITYQGNEKLRSLLDKYKLGHHKFQTYEGIKTNWKLRKGLGEQLDKTTLPVDVNLTRYEGWGFWDSIPSPTGKSIGEEIRKLQAKNASPEEIREFVLSLGPVNNRDFISTSLNTSTQYFENKPVVQRIFAPENTQGLYIEDILSPSLSPHYESELILNKDKFFKITDINFVDNKPHIDTEVLLKDIII